jgi:carbamoyl-phosphate synthase small subunit
VKDLRTGKVVITSQNHGFAVAPDTLSGSRLEVTQVNANDGTVEGLALPKDKVFSVQYHPEAHPGPLDSEAFFQEFAKTVKGVRA